MRRSELSEHILQRAWEAFMSDEQESVSSSLSFTVGQQLQNNGHRRKDAGATVQGNPSRASRHFSGFCPRCRRKMQHKPKTKRTLRCDHCEIEVTPKWKRTKW